MRCLGLAAHAVSRQPSPDDDPGTWRGQGGKIGDITGEGYATAAGRGADGNNRGVHVVLRAPAGRREQMTDAAGQGTVGGHDADTALAREASIDGMVMPGASVALSQNGRGHQHVSPLGHGCGEGGSYGGLVTATSRQARQSLGVEDHAAHRSRSRNSSTCF